MKQRWYQSPWWKGFLIVLMHLCAVGIVVFSSYIVFSQGLSYLNFSKKAPKTYVQTDSFINTMRTNTEDALNYIQVERAFVHNKEIDKNQLVEISEYVETGNASEGNKEGVYYTIGELVNWSEKLEWISLGEDNKDNRVVVCKRVDGSYYYYRWSDFENQIMEGKIRFIDEKTQKTKLLARMQKHSTQKDSLESIGVMDEKGQLLFSNCWIFERPRLSEEFAPKGYVSLVDVANKIPKWNGRLVELYDMVSRAVERAGQDMSNYEKARRNLMEGNSNFTYVLLDKSQEKIYSNKGDDFSFQAMNEWIQKGGKKGNKTYDYVLIYPMLKDFKSHVKADISPYEWQNVADIVREQMGIENFAFFAGVDTNFPIKDAYYENNMRYAKIQPFLSKGLWLFWISVLFFVISFIWLTIVAGRSNKEEGVALNTFDRWPLEIPLGMIVGGLLFFVYGLGGNFMQWYTDRKMRPEYLGQERFQSVIETISPGMVVAFSLAALGVTCVCLIGYLSIVRRCKGRTLWKNCLIVSIFRGIIHFFTWFVKGWSEFWNNRKVVQRDVSKGILVLLGNGIAFGSRSGIFLAIAIFMDIWALIYLGKEEIARKRIKEGIERISSGDMEYKVPLEGLRGETLLFAEHVNNIGEGLQKAVEQSVKSERMKTDLITNVSHDIKTPLTSIINYIELLKREKIDNERVQGYIAVLEEKAQRLKTLTEDVVEASKISSGNIHLDIQKINFVEMIQQTEAEFTEKFEARDLQVISTLPSHGQYIMADGRRMWRVLANIYNNAAKYAMKGTRIYADLTEDSDMVTFSLKNVSEQPLNIKAEELTERFIRGDISRSTEGSGLGLSIAKNLTERQNGTFTIYLDGDLFKVSISFPKVKEEA